MASLLLDHGADPNRNFSTSTVWTWLLTSIGGKASTLRQSEYNEITVYKELIFQFLEKGADPTVDLGHFLGSTLMIAH